MKKLPKFLFLLALVSLLAACSKSDDESTGSSFAATIKSAGGQKETRSYSGKFVWDGYAIPVYCNGDKVDDLLGEVNYHDLVHYQKGVFTWGRIQYNGNLKSLDSGENFTVKEEYYVDPLTWLGKSHINVIGDNGSHYILTCTWDLNQPDWGMVTVKAVCP